MRVLRALATVTLLGLVTLAGCRDGSKKKAYPEHEVTLVIPAAPGDAADIAGRLYAEEMGKALKVPVVAVNKPGASMTIGTDSVAKAQPDGYTILLTTNAALTSARIANAETVAYDPQKDLTPLGSIARTPQLLVVKADAPYKTLSELIEFSKKNPGKVRVGTIGAGSLGHFAVEGINASTGAGLTMVPFKGMGPTMSALLGGHVEVAAPALGAASGQIKSGAVRALLTSSKIADHPEIPTATEAGLTEPVIGVWLGFFGPANLDATARDTLTKTIETVTKEASVTTRLAGAGVVSEYQAPATVTAEIGREQTTLEGIAKRSGIGQKK